MQQGMHNGLRFGLLLTLFYALTLGSAHLPWLNLPGLVCLAALPVALFVWMRKDYIASKGLHTVGTLWLNGLLTVIGGALLASVPMVIFLQWISPDFLPQLWESMVQVLDTSADVQARNMAADIRVALDNGFAISPIIFTLSLLWTATFLGSILSLIMGIVIKASGPRFTKSFN